MAHAAPRRPTPPPCNICSHAASSYGNKEVIQWLLANGANVNIKDEDGDSPLSVCEEPVCAQVLLDAGADLAAANNEGHCAIQVAHIDYRDEMVEFYRSVYASRSVPVPELPERDGDDDDDDEENEGDMSDEDEDE